MEQKLKRIVNWLTGAGMRVNESKMELCLFHRGDSGPIKININGKEAFFFVCVALSGPRSVAIW